MTQLENKMMFSQQNGSLIKALYADYIVHTLYTYNLYNVFAENYIQYM
jgi:hypothetical protein